MPPRFIAPAEAVGCIRPGDAVGISAMISQVNPVHLTGALAARFRAEGRPGGLRVYCPGNFGTWEPGGPGEDFVRSGAVRAVTMSFYSSAPDTAGRILAGEMAGYNLPYGVMCHSLRAAAGGHRFYLTHVGENLFVDPARGGGSGLNGISPEIWVESVEFEGERILRYRTPELDVALLRGTSADRYGNISFERESGVCEARELAMAVHNRGGRVLAEVARRTEEKMHPWDVVVPGCLVDCISVCPPEEGWDPYFSNERFVEPERLAEHVFRVPEETAPALVTARAARELRPGQIANLGVGMPEGVGVHAALEGLLPQLTMTLETGTFGGLPAPRRMFGSAVGSMCVMSNSSMFDFLDGGGLDVTFIGALEIDGAGNVNAHHNPKRLAGIGGLADVTHHTRKVVFCATFTSGGLEVERDGERLRILREGRYPKFVERVSSVSFSAQNARQRGQEVLYVTERCVFRLGAEGLELVELAPGVDLRTQVLDRLPFAPRLCLGEKRSG